MARFTYLLKYTLALVIRHILDGAANDYPTRADDFKAMLISYAPTRLMTQLRPYFRSQSDGGTSKGSGAGGSREINHAPRSRSTKDRGAVQGTNVLKVFLLLSQYLVYGYVEIIVARHLSWHHGNCSEMLSSVSSRWRTDGVR